MWAGSFKSSSDGDFELVFKMTHLEKMPGILLGIARG